MHWGIDKGVDESLIRLLLDNNADTNIVDKVTPGTRVRGWCMVWIWCVVQVVVWGEDGVGNRCSKGARMGITGEGGGEGEG